MGILPLLDSVAVFPCQGNYVDNTKSLSKFLWFSPFLKSQLLLNWACQLDIWIGVVHKTALDLQITFIRRAALLSER